MHRVTGADLVVRDQSGNALQRVAITKLSELESGRGKPLAESYDRVLQSVVLCSSRESVDTCIGMRTKLLRILPFRTWIASMHCMTVKLC